MSKKLSIIDHDKETFKMEKPLVIAYYLPQYHPIPENDKWWGNGFTEWTNVAKARPLFKGHYQPKIPADLGFYDLRIPEVREQQAELAREAGVDGFCYWHYWFGNGKELLERPFKEVVESGKPDFPFCLGWANEDWVSKNWSQAKVQSAKQTLIAQEYPGDADDFNHFQKYLSAFKDSRYLKIDGKPIFLIYKPFLHPYITKFMKQWNKLLCENSQMKEFFFIGVVDDECDAERMLKMGFSAVTLNLNKRMSRYFTKKNFIYRTISNYFRWRLHRPFIVNYANALDYLWDDSFDGREYIIPTLLPNWDHTPRNGIDGFVLSNTTPNLFKKHCFQIFQGIKNKKNKIVFLKSWNEWGEGNYMEPDAKFGKGFLKALAEARKKIYP